jgi:hypothetical protein
MWRWSYGEIFYGSSRVTKKMEVWALGEYYPFSPVPKVYKLQLTIINNLQLTRLSLFLYIKESNHLRPHPSGCPFQGRGYSNRFDKFCRGVKISPHDRRSRHHRHGLDRPNEISYPDGMTLGIHTILLRLTQGSKTQNDLDDHTTSNR